MRRTQITFFVILALAVGVIYFFNANRSTQITSDTPNEPAPPPPGTVVVSISSSNTKQKWFDAVVTNFNASNPKTPSGKSIHVQVKHVTSGGSLEDIKNGVAQPVVWSPGSQSWIEQLNQVWQQRDNKPISSQVCKPTVYDPIGFAMWRPMAETLGWPDKPIGWDTLVALAKDPQGWGSYGRPEWGQFRFGHSHPGYSNSGLLAMTSFVYGVSGQGLNLTAQDVYADDVKDAMTALEQVTAKYGRQAPDILNLMARQGPNYLHAATAPEGDTMRFNEERKAELSQPLVFIFPEEGTIWGDHPYCILDNAEWVDPEQLEAAKVFESYLLAKEQQAMAIDFYLRPIDKSISLRAPMTLENGTDPRITIDTYPALPSPSADISNAVIDLFKITKRKATVLIVLDISGSMEGEKIKTARESTAEFLQRLDANDEVGVMVFSDNVTTFTEPTRAGDVVENLAQRVRGVIEGGSTNLYGAVCEAIEEMNLLKDSRNENRLYGIVLLSDGEDTVEQVTENQMFATCLPANAEADGIKIFPIAFGEDADTDVLSRIAAVTAGQMFKADPASIANVYVSISAEQ
ncbi:MAG: VWA domain-containing protein [Trueperaceae bacterium]